MVKKFIYSFLGIIGYMAAYALTIIPILLIRSGFTPGQEALVMVIWSLGAVIFFFPALILLIRKIWFFPAESGKQAVSLDKLREEILSINDFDAPVTAKEEKPNRIRLTWKYVDAKWWEILKKAGLHKTYELIIILDESTHTARLIDVTKAISWGAGPTEASASWVGTRGIIFALEIGKAWGIKENFSLGKIYDYRFNPSEIKNPVMNTILRRGWNVQFAIF
jgi:hypothetical protein